MTIQEIYDLAINMGTGADPRGKKGVQKYLERQKKSYEELPERISKIPILTLAFCLAIHRQMLIK